MGRQSTRHQGSTKCLHSCPTTCLHQCQCSSRFLPACSCCKIFIRLPHIAELLVSTWRSQRSIGKTVYVLNAEAYVGNMWETPLARGHYRWKEHPERRVAWKRDHIRDLEWCPPEMLWQSVWKGHVELSSISCLPASEFFSTTSIMPGYCLVPQ